MTVVEHLSIEKYLEHLLAADVGEIIFNCVHKDGTLSGPDLCTQLKIISPTSAANKCSKYFSIDRCSTTVIFEISK